MTERELIQRLEENLKYSIKEKQQTVVALQAEIGALHSTLSLIDSLKSGLNKEVKP